jgi:type VI secretion system secreted protein Hcp
VRTQRSRVTVGLGKGVFLVLLAAAILAMAGELGISREAPRLVATQASSAPAAMGTDVFITFDGMPGESKDKEHAGWCDALSFEQGLTNSAISHIGSGGGTGSADLHDVVVTKLLDKASPKLAQAGYQGLIVKNVKIHITRMLSGGAKTYYTCELTDAVISSYNLNASIDHAPVEEVSIGYRTMNATYTELDAAGAAKSTTTFTCKKP